MRDISEAIAEKLEGLINLTLSKLIKPDITVENVRKLDKEQIRKLKDEKGIEGIILDVDETIRKNMQDIPACNKEWIKAMQGELKVIILTNGKDKALSQYFEEQGIDYIDFALKPLKKNFKKACKLMNLKPDQVMVVGDDLFDDIFGGKKNKMKTVLVKSVEENER